MLRNRSVCGINNLDVQTRLLEKADLTSDNAVQTTLAIEAAKKDTGEIAQASDGNVFSTRRSRGAGHHLLPLWGWTPCNQMRACENRLQLLPQARAHDGQSLQFETEVAKLGEQPSQATFILSTPFTAVEQSAPSEHWP